MDIWNKHTKLGKPYSATWPKWREWRKSAKADYPILYWLTETVPIWSSVKWRRYATDPYWAVVHRINPRHRYHVIKPKTLKPGYHDGRSRMMHSTFHEIVEYYEGHDIKRVNWDWQDEHQKAYTTITEIYEWWTVERPNREDTFEKENPSPKKENDDEYFLDFLDDDSDDGVEYRKYLKKYSERETTWYEKDQEMLHKAIDVRPFLW